MTPKQTKKVSIVALTLLQLAGQNALADPATACREFQAQIKAKKTFMEQTRAEKTEQAMSVAQAYQSCFMALEGLKQQDLELRRTHPDPSDRSIQPTLEALRQQIDAKTSDCAVKLEAERQMEEGLAPYLENLQTRTLSELDAMNRQAIASGCAHPCLSEPGYCSSDAPSAGLIARGRRDTTNTGVVGQLFGSCQYRVEMALGTPYAIREEYCQEYYNVASESAEHMHQVCRGLQNGQFRSGPCAIPGSIGACTLPNGSRNGFVLREFVYQNDPSRTEEFKRSCHRSGKGIWEHGISVR